MESNLLLNNEWFVPGNIPRVGDMAELVISQHDIWSMNYAPSVTQLFALSDEISTFSALRGSLFLRFKGFENDIDALTNVPQIVHFTRQLFKQWPFFLHFLNRANGDLTLLMALLSKRHQFTDDVVRRILHFEVSQEAITRLIVQAVKLNGIFGAFESTEYVAQLEQDVRRSFPKPLYC
jgi:hypothetical protein